MILKDFCLFLPNSRLELICPLITLFHSSPELAALNLWTWANNEALSLEGRTPSVRRPSLITAVSAIAKSIHRAADYRHMAPHTQPLFPTKLRAACLFQSSGINALIVRACTFLCLTGFSVPHNKAQLTAQIPDPTQTERLWRNLNGRQRSRVTRRDAHAQHRGLTQSEYTL